MNFFYTTIFLLVNLVFRWPIFIILLLLKPFELFGFIFLAYPGSDKDIEKYCPLFLAKSWIFRGRLTIGGIITKGKSSSRGLILVVPNSIQEFQNSLELCKTIKRRLLLVKYLIGAKSIAMAGRLPGVFIRNGIKLEFPFVKGVLGTVFCVMDTVDRVMEINKDIKKIAQIGVGHVGGVLLDALKNEKKNIVGIDIKTNDGKIVFSKDSPRIIASSNLIIVLTPKGSDFLPYIKYLKKNTIIIDDTHPMIKDPIKGSIVYKVAVGLSGMRFIPSLSGYKSDWIPGCAIEGCVASICGDVSNLGYKEFNNLARSIGFYSHLIKR
jgi:hypothetical protein